MNRNKHTLSRTTQCQKGVCFFEVTHIEYTSTEDHCASIILQWVWAKPKQNLLLFLCSFKSSFYLFVKIFYCLKKVSLWFLFASHPVSHKAALLTQLHHKVDRNWGLVSQGLMTSSCTMKNGDCSWFVSSFVWGFFLGGGGCCVGSSPNMLVRSLWETPQSGIHNVGQKVWTNQPLLVRSIDCWASEQQKNPHRPIGWPTPVEMHWFGSLRGAFSVYELCSSQCFHVYSAGSSFKIP